MDISVIICIFEFGKYSYHDSHQVMPFVGWLFLVVYIQWSILWALCRIAILCTTNAAKIFIFMAKYRFLQFIGC